MAQRRTYDKRTDWRPAFHKSQADEKPKLFEEQKKTDNSNLNAKIAKLRVKLGKEWYTGIKNLQEDKKLEEHIDKLIKISNSESVGELVVALDDKNSDIRRVAAKMLGEIKDPISIHRLLGALRHEDPKTRRNAAGALGEIGDERAVPGLLNALWDPVGYVRMSTARALSKIGRVAAVDGMINVLADKSAPGRKTIARELGRVRYPEAVRGLVRALEDKDKEVRARAFDSLVEIGKYWRGDIVAVLEIGDQNSRANAAKVLGEIGGAYSREELENALKNERSSSVRKAIETSLSKIGTHSNIDGLADMNDEECRKYE